MRIVSSLSPLDVGKQEEGGPLPNCPVDGFDAGWAAGVTARRGHLARRDIRGLSFVSIIGLPQHFYLFLFLFLEIDKTMDR